MNPMLRLCEDVFANGGAMELPAVPRMIFVVHGSIAIADRTLRDQEAFGGEGAILRKANSSFAATASPFRPAAALICTGIRGPASAVSSRAASASIRTAARRRMGPAAPGMRPGPTPCSHKPPIVRRASSA